MMILRRFMQHVREQNWLAVVIDVIVVVGSVFLATQLSIALEKHRAEQDLQASMRNLHREFSRELAWTESAIAWQKRVMAGLRDTLAVLDGAEPKNFDQDRIHKALEEGISPPPGLNFQATLQELRDSGEFRRIPYEDLSSILIEVLGMKESTPAYYEGLMRSANQQPLDYPFIERSLFLEAGQEWGTTRVTSIDWERARVEENFRFRVLQFHDVFAVNTLMMESSRELVAEAVAVLERRGFEATNDWWSENIDSVEAQVRQWTGEIKEESDTTP